MPPVPGSEPRPEPRIGIVARILLVPLWVYRRTLSRLIPEGTCRYLPTCSEYTVDAIRRNGAFWGVVYGVRRVCRCHPFAEGGYDPAPDRLAGGAPVQNDAGAKGDGRD